MEIQGDEAGKHNDLGSTGERQALHQLQPLARAAPTGRSTGHRRGRLGRGARGVHRRAVASELARRALGVWSVAAVDGVGGGFCRRALTLSRRPPHPPNPKNHHNTRVSLAARSFYGARVEKHETRPFLGTILRDKPERLPQHAFSTVEHVGRQMEMLFSPARREPPLTRPRHADQGRQVPSGADVVKRPSHLDWRAHLCVAR